VKDHSATTTDETISRIGNTPTAHYRILDPLRDRLGHEAAQELGKRTYDALQAFTALQGETVTIGWLHPKTKDTVNGRAYSQNRMFCLPADEYTTNITLYHELGHIAIWIRDAEMDEDHPTTSEEYCSIYSVAQMPPKAVDEQRIPYLGKSPLDTERFPKICQRALEYRENHRNYIQQCREWLEI